MLKKQQRLARLLFSEVFARGKRIQGPHATLIVAKAPGFGCSVVVSKKVAKKAHERNRIKRRLYALVRELAGVNPPPLAVIIITKPPISKLNKTGYREILPAEIGRALNNR